jgi:hypothetical protein
MADPPADAPHVRRNFLPPAQLLRLLGALDRLAGSWASSEALGLLGRGGTHQVRATDLAVQGPLGEVRELLAPATLRWAQTCGFRFSAPPHLQMFPVRMVGDAKRPPHQEPHADSSPGLPGAPVCTSVFYATAKSIDGGDLALAGKGGIDDPIVVRPTPNTLVSFAGDRVHWVLPLLAGERVSIVINFYAAAPR